LRTNKLGRTGLFVSELCLGTMTFGGSEGMWRQMTILDATPEGRGADWYPKLDYGATTR